MKNIWNCPKVLITGGAGFLGSKIVERLYNTHDIVVYSRDEAKHYFLKKRFPQAEFIIGDVNNLNGLVRAGRGCNLAIYCAALKQIEAVEENPEAGLNTIGIGAINSKLASIENNIQSSCIISSDKASAPQTSYGALKLFSENVFVNNNSESLLNFSACRYGNVYASKGSLIPIIWDAIKYNYELVLYSDEMTRFGITVDDAIDLILYSLKTSNNVIIPNLYSYRILDVFEIYKEKFGLRYKMGKPRPNEKIHEIMFSGPESRRIEYNKENNLFLLKNDVVCSDSFVEKEFSSKDYVVDRKQLKETLIKNEYFRE